MRARIGLALAGALLFDAAAALAWEGLCRSEQSVGGRAALGVLLGNPAFDHSICAMHDEPRCDGGIEAARGVQLGEHTDLTVRAMRAAGLPDALFDPITIRYWTSDVPLFGGDQESWAPASSGGMRRLVERELFLAELGEGPDISHSLSDYLLGNEHCFVSNVRTADLDEMNACHEFTAHMGPINSTHWPLLARPTYEKLHAHALRVADRCKAMDDAVRARTGTHALGFDMQTRVEACEREALAIEAFASHYLEDAWSSGHMWDRWGPPVPPRSDEDKLRAFLATAMVGLIHGSRGVLDEDDQLCMPGVFPGDPATSPVVEYRHGDAELLRPAGGDLYLDSCNAGQNGLSVRAIEPLRSSQFDGMLRCVALGFVEVYEHTGQRHGAFAGQDLGDYEFAPSVERSTDDGCWDMRVTNQSMVLGLGTMATGLGRVTAVDLTDPKFWSRMAVRYKIDDAVDKGERNLALDLPFFENDRAETEFRTEAIRTAYVMIAEAQGEDGDPGQTDVASGDTSRTASFMGVLRSSHWAQDIRQDAVPYLEHSNPAFWTDLPSSSCAHDHDCPDRQVCDPSVVVPDGVGGVVPQPACVPHEVGILRAFREAEVPYWCDGDDLELARAACKQDEEACEACIEMVIPHMRNACGPADYVEHAGDVDRRSMCDVFGAGEEGDYVYGPHLDGDQGSLVRTASNLCRGVYGLNTLTERLEVVGHTDGPPAQAGAAHLGMLTHSGAVCGGEALSEWLRFVHDPPNEDHEHLWAVRAIGWLGGGAGDARQLDVQMFAGPRCGEEDRIDAPRELTDSNADGVSDTITITQTVPAGQTGDVCFRIRGATRETYWHGFRFATAPMWLDQ